MTDKTDAGTDTTANDNAAARLQGHGLQASFGSLSETVRRLAVDLANEAGARAIAQAQLAEARQQLETLRAEVEKLKGASDEKPKAKPAA
jgi:cell division protein FtsB